MKDLRDLITEWEKEVKDTIIDSAIPKKRSEMTDLDWFYFSRKNLIEHLERVNFEEDLF